MIIQVDILTIRENHIIVQIPDYMTLNLNGLSKVKTENKESIPITEQIQQRTFFMNPKIFVDVDGTLTFNKHG